MLTNASIQASYRELIYVAIPSYIPYMSYSCKLTLFVAIYYDVAMMIGLVRKMCPSYCVFVLWVPRLPVTTPYIFLMIPQDQKVVSTQ